MPKTALGLHFAPDRLTLVRLKGGMKGASVSAVEVRNASPAEREEALASFSLPREVPLVTSLGSDEIFRRTVSLPFGDRTRVIKAAPFEAEETLPLPLERLTVHTRILSRASDGARAEVLGVASETLRERLSLFERTGSFVKAVDSDANSLALLASLALPDKSNTLLVDLDKDRCQAVFAGKSGVEGAIALSSNSLDGHLPREILSFTRLSEDNARDFSAVYLTGPDAVLADKKLFSEILGAPVELLPFPGRHASQPPKGSPPWPSYAVALGLALSESLGKTENRADFLSSRARRENREAGLKGRVTALAALLLLSAGFWGASEAVTYANRKTQLDAVNADIKRVFTQAMPGTKTVVDEVAQLKQRIAEDEERARTLGGLLTREISPLRVLKELSSRIPADVKVEFRDFAAEQDRVRIEGETDSFESIDKIKAKLSEYPWFTSVTVSDAKASVDQTKKIFKMTIALAQTEAEK